MKSFCKHFPLVLVLAMLLASGLGLRSAWAEAPTESLRAGVLVLNNGNVVRGKVQHQGGYYHVHLAGGTLRVPDEQVDMWCQNLEEAYQRRCESRAGSTADSHLELARWCLRHKLYTQAETELKTAQSIDSDNRRVQLVERQLKQLVQLEALKEKRQLEVARVIPEPTPLDTTNLDKAPRWARALFVRQIQPLIVQSCATSGCHQCGSESNFQLNRLATDGAGHPEATLTNLSATLAHIDWQATPQSSLLERARQAHGPEGSSTTLADSKWKVLEGWVEQLAEAHQLEQLQVAAQQGSKQPNDPPVLQTATRIGVEIGPAMESAAVRGEVRLASAVDPFDPAAFNARQAAERKHASALAVPSRMDPAETASQTTDSPSEGEASPTPLPAVE